jgi:uncharacterized protein
MSDRSSEGGFASMDDEKKRKIASEGGKAAHERGTAHEFDSEGARRAGNMGGETVGQDREHMAEIGRRGGEESRDRRR